MTGNAEYLADFEELLGVCAERGVAVQTIKSITRAPWASDEGHHAATWYEPLTDQGAIDTAVAWVLGRPDIFLNTVGDIHLLPKVLDAAAPVHRPAERRRDGPAGRGLGDGAPLRLTSAHLSAWVVALATTHADNSDGQVLPGPVEGDAVRLVAASPRSARRSRS